jgi:carbonic anhydrase
VNILKNGDNMQVLMWYRHISGRLVDKGPNSDSLWVNSTDGEMAFVNHDKNVRLFKILQFHMHAPSEHTINGKNYDLELHLVHQSPTNKSQLSVIAIFFDTVAGDHHKNPFLESLIINEVI